MSLCFREKRRIRDSFAEATESRESFKEFPFFCKSLCGKHFYGTLLSGERNHHFCRNAVKITPCTATGTLYNTGYGFPAFQEDGNTIVKAELIEIPIADWAAVDRLEGYPRLYDRQLISCTLPDGATDTG